MTDFFKTYLPNVYLIPDEFVETTKQTLYISFWTAFIGGMIGVILGVMLVATCPNRLLANHLLFEILDKLINIIRSIPFIILLPLLALTTRSLVGTTIGAKTALVPLIFGVVPFSAHQIGNALLEVDPGMIEAAEVIGTSLIGIILHVYLLEGLPGIIRVSVLTIINTIGLTTMARVVGAGGLGDLTISKGYNRFQTDVTIVAILLTLTSVLLSQFISSQLIKKITR